MNLMAFSSRRRSFGAIAMALVMAVTLSGCLGGFGGSGGTTTKKEDKNGPPKFEKGTSMETIQQRGKLFVGVIPNEAPFTSLNRNQGTWQGFDVEVAQEIARAIFGANIEGKIEWIPLQPNEREDAIRGKRVDIAVGRYVITQGRKNFVDFAGPYYMATQDIIVRANPRGGRNVTTTTEIKTLFELNGRKVCSVTGSTNIDALAAAVPRSDRSVVQPSVSECMSKLGNNSVDAVAAMHVDLIPALKAAGDNVALFPGSYGAEPFGIGMAKGDTKFRSFLNDTIENWQDWDEAYQTTTGDRSVDKPTVDRY